MTTDAFTAPRISKATAGSLWNGGEVVLDFTDPTGFDIAALRRHFHFVSAG